MGLDGCLLKAIAVMVPDIAIDSEHQFITAFQEYYPQSLIFLR